MLTTRVPPAYGLAPSVSAAAARMRPAGRPKIRVEISRKPEPPALDPFTCAVCEQEIKRDPYNPEWQRGPVCNSCAWRTPTRPQLAWTSPEQWGFFTKAHALLCAIEQEIKNARSAR